MSSATHDSNTADSPQRPRRRRRLAWLALLLALVGVGAIAYSCRGLLPALIDPPGPLHVRSIRLPAGFSIAIYAEDVTNARSMTLSPSGTLFVGSRDAGNVYAIPDADRDRVGDRVVTLAEDLNQPNGVAFRDGALYVAEIHRIIRFDDIEARLDDPPEPVVAVADLPEDEHHGWKFLAFGPDGWLYVPQGVPCNICDEDDPRFGTILRTRVQPGTQVSAEGTGLEVYAEGIRNSVGFDWHPETHELWFTDNGRDGWGDDRPPDELNHAPRAGLHFGFPHCHGRGLLDDEWGQGRDCGDFTPAALELGPHVAALGMRFSTSSQFPEEYRGGVFIAEHGSWNRTDPIGYRVMYVPFENGQPASYDVFAEGWLDGGMAWGRPVDVEWLDDGSLLVSDDRGDAIYRISYTNP